MLDQKDLQAIAELMDCRISKTEEKMIKEMNKRVLGVETGPMSLSNRIDEVETTLTNRIDAVEQKVSEAETSLSNKIDEVESTLAKQLIRAEDILTRRMTKMSSKLVEIGEYYRVEKLENGNMGMVLQILEEYQKRLKDLEMKIA